MAYVGFYYLDYDEHGERKEVALGGIPEGIYIRKHNNEFTFYDTIDENMRPA
jgi:hypothetical protein